MVDPRITRTRNALIGAVIRELETTDLADLTVAGVSKAAGVSRVAFYDRFGTMDALLVAAMEEELDQVRVAAAALEPDPARTEREPPSDLVDVFRIISARANLFRALVDERGNAAFIHRVRLVLRSAVEASMHRHPRSQDWPVGPEVYYDFMAGATLSVVIGWLQRTPLEPVEQIAGELWWLISSSRSRPDEVQAAL